MGLTIAPEVTVTSPRETVAETPAGAAVYAPPQTLLPQDPRPQPCSIVPVAVSSPREAVSPNPVRAIVSFSTSVPQL